MHPFCSMIVSTYTVAMIGSKDYQCMIVNLLLFQAIDNTSELIVHSANAGKIVLDIIECMDLSGTSFFY